MPVPIPNTEAKLPCADDTAHGGKVGSGRLLSYTCFHAPPEGASFFSERDAAGAPGVPPPTVSSTFVDILPF